MTVSILALDGETGQFGVAVASFVLAVGAAVPHLAPGVGAVVVQGAAPSGWGPWVIELLRQRSASEVVALLGAEPGAAAAQVAAIDAAGTVDSWSGPDEPYTGSAVGGQVCAVANLMERREVPEAVVDGYQRSNASTFSGRSLTPEPPPPRPQPLSYPTPVKE